MIRRPPRSTPLYSSAASDVYKRQAQRMGEEALGLGADGLFPRRERRSRVRIWHRRIPVGCFGLQGHGQNMRGLAGRWGLLVCAFCIMDGWALPATVVDNNQQ